MRLELEFKVILLMYFIHVYQNFTYKAINIARVMMISTRVEGWTLNISLSRAKALGLTRGPAWM